MSLDQMISELVDEGFIQCITDGEGFTYYWATEGPSLFDVLQQQVMERVINEHNAI